MALETFVKANGLVKPCCMPEHLKANRIREDLLVRVCEVCGCRHIEFDLDPGRIFVREGA